MLELYDLVYNVCIITIIQSIIFHQPILSKYSNEIKFNYYRSLMCITFTCIGINILLSHFLNGLRDPFHYMHPDMNEAYNLFIVYLAVDLIYMAATKNTRTDLYLHHILIILSLIVCYMTNSFGYLQSVILICEIISIVSGVDSMALDDKDSKLSYLCKKFRKFSIKYIRIPIWIILFIYTIRYTDKLSGVLWYAGIILSGVMIYLDKYWENKCDKVISKYENI
jgi:hypothetical protein